VRICEHLRHKCVYFLDLAFVMAVTVQNIVVLCDVTPCSLVGFVSTFSAVPRLQVGRELSSDIVQYTDFTSEFAVFGMSCGLMVNVWL